MKKKLIIVGSFVVLAIVGFFIYRALRNKNPLDVDVSHINITVTVDRFDKELQQVREGDPYPKLETINKKYNEFFDVYNSDIIGIGGFENSSYLTYLETFLNDYSVKQATKEVSVVFKDMSTIETDLTSGFKHLVYYYPEVKVPRIISFIAGFNHSVVVTENFIGIGLDKYLGEKCELYTMLEIPDFSRIEMNKEQIPFDVLRAWAETEYPFEPQTENLLEKMLYNGRTLYFLDAMFPDYAESKKLKYTDAQVEYCKVHERDMWTYLVENKLFFDTNLLNIRKLTDSAPFTAQFGPDSPPRTANWIGLQIVKSYMKNNDVTIPDLMAEKDFQKILSLSEYDPDFK